jgi:hypothetical protein
LAVACVVADIGTDMKVTRTAKITTLELLLMLMDIITPLMDLDKPIMLTITLLTEDTVLMEETEHTEHTVLMEVM